jgi:Sortase domain
MTSAPGAITTSTTPAIQFALRSTPVQLRVPAIALTVSLSTLGLNSNGTVQVPTDIQQPGWYRLGPSPGQDGSAVILGHVDSYQGPATFFKLRTLVPGDPVYVTLADGVSAQFKVTFVAQYLKTGFPDQLVYAGHGSSSLQLVTCGGAFDSQTGHYLSNVVVYTSLVALTPSGATTAVPVALQPLNS